MFVSGIRSCSVGLILFAIMVPLKAEETEKKNDKTGSAYCGIYAMYAIAKMHHFDVAFPDLIKKEYISSPKGSSFSDLQKLGQDYNLHAEPVKNLSLADLKEITVPAILNVKTDAGRDRYDHYELFLGIEGEYAKLFNPPEKIQYVALYDLASRWKGDALLVSSSPVNMEAIRWMSRKRQMFYFIFIGMVVIAVKLIQKAYCSHNKNDRAGTRASQAIHQSIFILAGTMVLAYSFHLFSDYGFLNSAEATLPIIKGHQGDFIPKVSKSKTEKLLQKGAVIIDARYTADYENGHIEGAINIPVDSDEDFLREAIKNIDKDAEIILYCHSVGCKFAEHVAIRLQREHYTKISIYKGGWMDWSNTDI